MPLSWVVRGGGCQRPRLDYLNTRHLLHLQADLLEE
jgi:hypothetical protein